ncbi:MAG: hypothetical protein ACRCVV_13255 [Shewanella sp.]
MEGIKLGMLITGLFDQFEIELTSIEPIKDGDNALNAPYLVKVIPESYLTSLRTLLDGEVMYGHIPFMQSDELALIASPRRMLAIMEKNEYEIRLTDNFAEYLQDE